MEVTDHYNCRYASTVGTAQETSTSIKGGGGYANYAIDWDGTRGEWNAEFIIDDYDGQKIILRPLRDIAQGEQIFAWYGPQYRCDPQHPVEMIAKAVITYGIVIDKLTEASGSQGARRELPAATLYKLRSLVTEKGY